LTGTGDMASVELPAGETERVRDQILADLADVAPRTGTAAMYSTLTGDRIDPEALTAQHWYDSLRNPVLFEQATRALLRDGLRLFVESSPHPTLLPAIEHTAHDCLPHDATPIVSIASQRRDQDQTTTFATALATAFAHGLPIQWPLPQPAPTSIVLPTYPFQRQRFWLNADHVTNSPRDLGQVSGKHPVLAAIVELPDNDTTVLTGRISRHTQPWITDHTVQDAFLLPGAALAELALHAGRQASCAYLTELTLEAPLVLVGDEACAIQVEVGAPSEQGYRPVAIRSRVEEGKWIRHAIGTLTSDDTSEGADFPAELAEQWPPSGAVAIDIGGLYTALAATGLEYGSAFQGVCAAWHVGSALYAEVALPQDAAASGWGIHPTLLDMSLHATALLADTDDATESLRLPFMWTGVALHAVGATRLRVRLQRIGADKIALYAADTEGIPVVSISALAHRPMPAGYFTALHRTTEREGRDLHQIC
jgi:polyketide synthase 12